MGLVQSQEWVQVMKGFLKEKLAATTEQKIETKSTLAFKNEYHGDDESVDDYLDLNKLELKDYLSLWAGFGPTASRELAFAIPKFLVFDIIAKSIVGIINSNMGQGALPIQVGVGSAGLAISAFSGAFAGIAGVIVSHPAD